MKRFAVVIGLVVLAGACNKPSEESCRQAISNMRVVLGTADATADNQGDVRRCKGGSSKKSVECAINATTAEQLKACGFLKVPDKAAPAGGAPGSGAPAGAAPAGGAPAGGAPAGADPAGAAPAGGAPAGAAPAGAAPAGGAPAGGAPAGAAPAGGSAQ